MTSSLWFTVRHEYAFTSHLFCITSIYSAGGIAIVDFWLSVKIRIFSDQKKIFSTKFLCTGFTHMSLYAKLNAPPIFDFWSKK